MKVRNILSFALLTSVLAVSARAQLRGEPHMGCISTAAPITARGKLMMRHFAGPPNYESVRHGDEDGLVLILQLPVAACIDDTDVGTSHQRLRTVHVWTSDEHLRSTLHRLVGHFVTVTGEGYAAHSAHHRAPLVLEAKAVTAG